MQIELSINLALVIGFNYYYCAIKNLLKEIVNVSIIIITILPRVIQTINL